MSSGNGRGGLDSEREERAMRLVGVGMGPGDPELVTVKAVRLLRAADRVFVPVLDSEDTSHAEAAVRRHCEHDRVERLVLAGDERGGRTGRAWAAGAERVAGYLHSAGAGATAVVATIGDPNVYSPFSYLASAVSGLLAGVVVESVPGVTAAQDLASRGRVPLAEGAEPLTLLPLTGGVTGLAEALDRPGSVVAYKSGRHLTGVKEAVRRAGRLHGALYGARLGMAGELVRPLAAADASTAFDLSAVFIPARRTTRGGSPGA